MTEYVYCKYTMSMHILSLFLFICRSHLSRSQTYLILTKYIKNINIYNI